MQNARLDESQVGIKIVRRNINNFIYGNTLMAESKDELKSLLMKVKEEREKAGLKLNTKNAKIMASGPITYMANRRGKGGSSDRLLLPGF